MNSLETLKKTLKSQCEHAAHWELLLLQGFWYGLWCWLTTCAEDQKDPEENRLSAKQIVTLTDSKFESWPTDWLEDTVESILNLHLNEEELNTFFDEIDLLFKDTIPPNLDIFTTLGNGDFITNEQWDILQASVALFPPHNQPLTNRIKHKTRRARGKRALTPLRRRRGITHHHRAKVQTEINLPAHEQL
jgi:hypothetical protein